MPSFEPIVEGNAAAVLGEPTAALGAFSNDIGGADAPTKLASLTIE